jgi:hypothetical protein
MEDQQQAAPQQAPRQVPETVKLRHPHTGDVQVVEAVPAKLIPWMGLGYQQMKEAK